MEFIKRFISGKKCLYIYTDGSIRPERGASGLAAVLRDGDGQTRRWWARRAGRLNCNEAEYAAAVMALEEISKENSSRKLRELEIIVYSDSQVMVHQMMGLATPSASGLRKWHVRLRGLAIRFGQITFRHIPREQNRLADALANEAADGRDDG
jgi:ribonuclease HI